VNPCPILQFPHPTTALNIDAETGRNMIELSRVREFFAAYEHANAEFSIDKLAAAYADVFMFAGPQGVQSVNKVDFIRLLPRRKESFRAAGLSVSKLDSLEPLPLDSTHVLVKAMWTMSFERSGKEPAESHNASTYILRAHGDSFQIVFQLDHQDLAKRVMELCGVEV